MGRLKAPPRGHHSVPALFRVDCETFKEVLHGVILVSSAEHVLAPGLRACKA